MSQTSMKDFREALTSIISKSMNEDVYKTVRTAQKRQIARVVYREYEPIDYIRRFSSGGLIDNKNIVGRVGTSKKGVRLSVFNFTRPNLSQGDYYGKQYLTPLIVRGHRGGVGYYSWYPKPLYKSWQYAKPRDFISATRDELEATKLHVKSLERSLKRQGVNVKY